MQPRPLFLDRDPWDSLEDVKDDDNMSNNFDPLAWLLAVEADEEELDFFFD